MANGVFGFILHRIVSAGSVPMAIPGIEIKLRQFLVLLQGVGQGISELAAEPLIEFGQES